MPKTPNNEKKHIQFSYYELADAMGYSYSYFMNKVAKGWGLRDMTLTRLVDFIVANANPKRCYSKTVKQIIALRTEVNQLRDALDKAFQREIEDAKGKNVADEAVVSPSNDDELI